MTIVDTSNTTLGVRTLLQRAEWAANAFQRLDVEQVHRIVRATAEVAASNAQRFAELAVAETGFGVVRDKSRKNEAMSRGFVERYGSLDLVSARVDVSRGLLEVPRPAGVILALTPSTSPIAALYFKVLCALLTRSAIVISPHPAAVKTSVRAVELLADAAEAVGAPQGAIQVVTEPNVPIIKTLMADPLTKLILATGGGAVVRAAYESGTPALGVGPGNPPVLVDGTADVNAAAAHIVESKAFDNSVLCTAESVLIVVESVASALTEALRRQGAHVCSDDEVALLRAHLFPDDVFNATVVGRTAAELAKAAGFTVQRSVRLLVAPLQSVTDEEMLTHEKLCPVIGLRVVSNAAAGVREAQAILRVVGAGHSAVIHSQDPKQVLEFARVMDAHRITVNAPGSLGNAGLGTNLAPTMSVGTGFRGGCSSGDNLEPAHLVQWSRTSYADSAALPDFARLLATPQASSRTDLRLPPYPTPSNGSTMPTDRPPSQQPLRAFGELDLAELKKIVVEELAAMLGANHG